MSHHRALAVVALALSVTIASAGPRRPVPEASFLGRDGKVVAVPSAVGGQTLVLVYVAPHAPAAERLLEAMRQWAPPFDAARVVIIVDGQTAEAGQWVARLLPDAGAPQPLVLFDIDAKGRKAFDVSSVPTLMGVEDGEIRWDLAGVLNDPAALEPVIRNWTSR